MALAAEGGACCAQSGALRHLLPKHIAKGTCLLCARKRRKRNKRKYFKPCKNSVILLVILRVSLVYPSYMYRN